MFALDRLVDGGLVMSDGCCWWLVLLDCCS